jgi:hypothetical protein
MNCFSKIIIMVLKLLLGFTDVVTSPVSKGEFALASLQFVTKTNLLLPAGRSSPLASQLSLEPGSQLSVSLAGSRGMCLSEPVGMRPQSLQFCIACPAPPAQLKTEHRHTSFASRLYGFRSSPSQLSTCV